MGYIRVFIVDVVLLLCYTSKHYVGLLFYFKMIVLCEKCGTKYVVDGALINKKVCIFKCAYCDHSWTYEKHSNELVHDKKDDLVISDEDNKSDFMTSANEKIQADIDNKESNYVVSLAHDSVIGDRYEGDSFFSRMFKTQSRIWYVFLFLTIIVGTFMSIIALRNTSYETFSELYKLFNIFNVKNLSLKNVAYHVFKDGEQVNLLLSVDIVNDSSENNVVPDLYVLMLDKDNKVLKKLFFKSNNKNILAKSSYKFATKISQVPLKISRLVVNVVDPVEFLFLNKSE